MISQPKEIKLDQIAEIISDKFKNKKSITCYVGSNSAVPTASLEALTSAIESCSLPLPLLREHNKRSNNKRLFAIIKFNPSLHHELL